jgi:hypothetical protein
VARLFAVEGHAGRSIALFIGATHMRRKTFIQLLSSLLPPSAIFALQSARWQQQPRKPREPAEDHA